MGTFKKTVVAVAILSLPITASAIPTTIDFDGLADNTVLTTQYSGLGVTFSASEDGSAVGTLVSAFNGGHSSPNAWSNCFPVFCDLRADIIRMDFATPVSGLQFFTDTEGSLLPVFNAYDSSGTLLETVIATAGTYTLTSFSASGISYVEGIQPTDSWGYLIDTITFTAAPEPASLALLGLGLAALGFARRRKA